MATRVAMDANALMMPVEVGVRVFDELDRIVGNYDCVVPDAVVAELDKLSESGGAAGTAASVGRDLADRCEHVTTEESYADDAIHALATAGDVDVVVTNDRPLKDRLLAAGVPVIHLRGRNQLTRTQP